MQNRFMQTDGYSTLQCAESSTGEDSEDQNTYVVRVEISQETGYSKDGIDRYALVAAVWNKDPQVRLTSCHLFTAILLWHVVLFLPVYSSQAHGTISFLSLTV